MKKGICFYFTGTYHTKSLVEELRSELEKLSISLSLFPILQNSPIIDLKGYDYVFFSYPIYAFQAPIFYVDYLKKLTFPQKISYHIVKQSGEPFSYNNNSSSKIIKILKKQHCTIQSEFHFLYPYNILFPYPENFKKRLEEYNQKQMEIFLYDFQQEKNHLLSLSPFKKGITSMISFLERFGARLNSTLFHAKKKKCRKCDFCIKNCPLNNIKKGKEGYPKFKTHCQLCMRCCYYCPFDAISIGLLNPIKVNQKSIAKKKDNFLKKKFYRDYQKYFYQLDQTYQEIFSKPDF